MVLDQLVKGSTKVQKKEPVSMNRNTDLETRVSANKGIRFKVRSVHDPVTHTHESQNYV